MDRRFESPGAAFRTPENWIIIACGHRRGAPAWEMFKAAKDSFTSKAAQTFINQRIARYGQVQTLRIDSRTKTVELTCQLEGEVSPISVKVENYRVREVNGKKLLEVGSCSCSRPWLENLLNDLAKDRESPVPSWAAAAL
jgi:hypothetical protein